MPGVDEGWGGAEDVEDDFDMKLASFRVAPSLDRAVLVHYQSCISSRAAAI